MTRFLVERLLVLAVTTGLFFSPSPAAAEDPSEGTESPAPAEVEEPKLSKEELGLDLAILPGPFVTKETGLGLAALVAVSFYPMGRSEGSWPTQLSGSVSYTMRNQTTFKVTPKIYWDRNRWVIDGEYSFSIYPNRFYGIGNDTPTVYQLYTETVGDFRTEVRREVWDHLYLLGIHHVRAMFDFEREEVFDENDDELPLAPPLLIGVEGSEKGWSHGLGVGLLYDSRDNPVYPLEGLFCSTSILVYPEFLGGDYGFTDWTVDLRQYMTIVKKWEMVVALQLLHEARFGDAPFHQLSELGGPYQMRGFYRGRYRDDYLAVLQAEVRTHIWWQIYGVVFAGVGEVYGDTDFDLGEIQYVAGVGIRWRYKENILIRLDIGFGPGTSAVIFSEGGAY